MNRYSNTSLFFLSDCFQIDGSHSFVISKERITKLFPHSWGDPYGSNNGYQVVLNASVTEKLTQKTYYGETTVKLYRSAVVLKYAESNPKAFKAGFPFQALVRYDFPRRDLVFTHEPTELTKAEKKTLY